jgi:hypothetical protein
VQHGRDYPQRFARICCVDLAGHSGVATRWLLVPLNGPSWRAARLAGSEVKSSL